MLVMIKHNYRKVAAGYTHTRFIPKLFLLCILVLTLMSCLAPTQLKQPPDEVKLQLKWIHQAQFAGFYMAQEKGYYARENIRVTFLEGGMDTDILQLVNDGKADFGIMSPELILDRRGKGQQVTAIAAIFRRSAAVFMAMADSGIIRPRDFLGKKIALTSVGGAADFPILLKAMVKKLGLDINKIAMVPFDSTYATFLSREVDVTPTYSIKGLLDMRQKGLKLNLIWPSDYGVNFYSDTLFTTDRMVTQNPNLAARFLRASLQGWQEAIEDYQQAVTLTLKYSQNQDRQFQVSQMEAMLPLVHTGEGKIGSMQPEIWDGMYDILLDQGLLAKPFDVKQAYTLRLLEEVYGSKNR
jgi:NitT/TauT family transport system substrate-binding protein